MHGETLKLKKGHLNWKDISNRKCSKAKMTLLSSTYIVGGHVAGMGRKTRHKICRLVSRKEVKYWQKE